ncbi:MAG: hypothetical protein E4H15_05805 [Syntrophobacterales bacterium]|nr:MAG: hypothetical protein E4H15_05805 [Syntrophobacterales bacterium]
MTRTFTRLGIQVDLDLPVKGLRDVLIVCRINDAKEFFRFAPVSAVILAFLLLRETLDISLITGGAMDIGGAYLTNRKR